LQHLDIAEAARPFMARGLGYDGVVTGPVQAEGDVHKPADTIARASLTIAPGRRGVPVSGKLNLDYNGRADTVTLGKSYIALPNTRADLSGSLGQQVQVKLVSRNLNDFGPLVNGPVPVTLNRGNATLTATISGSLSAPRVQGHLAMASFAVEGRPFNSFD